MIHGNMHALFDGIIKESIHVSTMAISLSTYTCIRISPKHMMDGTRILLYSKTAPAQVGLKLNSVFGRLHFMIPKNFRRH